MTFASKLARLRAGTLAAEDFTHHDHVGVAAQALIEADFGTAHDWIADGIRALATRAGAPDKFSATITFFYLSEIAERLARQTSETGEAFVANNPDLLASEFLKDRFSPERLAHPASRKIPLLPDRSPA